VALNADQRVLVQRTIDDGFVSGFRMVVLGAAILALAGAGFVAAIRDDVRNRQTATLGS